MSIRRFFAARLAALVCTCTAASAACLAGAASPAPDVPAGWATPAEAAGYEATPSYEETLAFLRRLEPRLPMKLTTFGTSAEGRPLPLVVISKTRAFTPQAAVGGNAPVILIVAGIHAGEIDGKDAMLALLRDAALGKEGSAARNVLDAGTILFVPIFNVDGHERVSPHHRPQQDGPRRGMGFRTTTAGLDLNRDYMKAVSPEMKAFLGLFNAWRPHLHVDNHVTDGCDFAWTVTHIASTKLPAAPSVAAWLDARLPSAFATLARAGFSSGPYVDLVDSNDPARGFRTRSGPPRFGLTYFALRNRASVLVEMHSYKPYRERVIANRVMLLALLEEVRRDPRGLVDAVAAAERKVVALGRMDAAPSELVVEHALDEKVSEPIRFPVYDWTTEPSLVTGQPQARYRRGRVREIEVPWFHTIVPSAKVARPRGYLVPPGWPQIEERLRVHGLRVLRTASPVRVEVETMRVRDLQPAAATTQGERPVTATVARALEERSLPAGTLFVPADQPDFEIAARLFEPESFDSLFSWGLLDGVAERKEYIDERVLEDFARAALDDPALAAEWARALEDATFAADSDARRLWWYRRHPSWDETVGLLPVFRLMRDQKIAFERRASTSR